MCCKWPSADTFLSSITISLASKSHKICWNAPFAILTASMWMMLKAEDLTIGSLRFGVSRVIPEMTQVALATRQHENMPELNDQARKKFLYRLSRADYEK